MKKNIEKFLWFGNLLYLCTRFRQTTSVACESKMILDSIPYRQAVQRGLFIVFDWTGYRSK